MHDCLSHVLTLRLYRTKVKIPIQPKEGWMGTLTCLLYSEYLPGPPAAVEFPQTEILPIDV